MLVRRLKEEEIREALIIAKVCFHSRTEDISKVEPDRFEKEAEQWGAFDDDGTLIARIQNDRYQSNLDGKTVENGGIGGVSTLPEYRTGGAVRKIFEALLPEARKNGEVISTLYPFSHAFYRKFGYETLVHQNIYEMTPEVLKDYHFYGTAAMFRPGDSVTPYTELYQAFTAHRNLALRRNDEYMKEEWLYEDPYKSRCFSYLLSEGGKPCAYVIFQDLQHDPQAILKVEEAVFRDRNGFLALLGFLSRFSADYGTIRLPLPTDIDLLSLIHSERSYSIKKSPRQDYMIRVVNAEKLLGTIRVPEGESFVIRVNDELLPGNCGFFRVTGGASGNLVERTEDPADLTVSEKALGQMAAGGIGLSEARLREDVEITGNDALLERVFRRKAIYIMDHF